jgi:hypothetical protein
LSNRPNHKSSKVTKTNRPATSSGRRVAAQQDQSGSRRATWIMAGVAAVVTVALVVAIVSTQGKSGPGNAAGTVAVTDPAALTATVAGVASDLSASVGSGSDKTLPTPIKAPPLTQDGKPLVLYVGAEYCPFCAGQRWAVVQALSRFGTFTGLSASHSSPDDVFPNTPTFTFHGATYSSTVVAFQGVELQDVDRKPLDTLSADQEAVFTAYNPKGSFPFIDFGGQYTLVGSSYSPQVLAGKSAEEIAASLSTAANPIAQGILGSANTMTATICILTNDQPASVCSVPAISEIEARIKAQPAA